MVKVTMPGHGRILALVVFAAILKIADSNQCLTMLEDVQPKRVIHFDGKILSINFEVSRRVTQRLATRIMKIFLKDVLGYPDIAIIENDDFFRADSTYARLSDKMIYSGFKAKPDVMVNMELWIPAHLDTMPLLNEYHVKEVGSIAETGRFGWFVPKQLANLEDNWHVFAKQDSASRFILDDYKSKIIKNAVINTKTDGFYCEMDFCQNGMYIPKQCEDNVQSCATLLAEYPDVTTFVKKHIDKLKLYVKVAWVGPNLKNLTKQLTNSLLESSSTTTISNKAIVILHWTPSKVIPNERDFVTIEFPRCGSRTDNLGCEYESNKLIKLVWERLEIDAKLAYDAIKRAKFTKNMYEDLINRYNFLGDEEAVACSWLKDNLNYTLAEWKPKSENKNSLVIGGIFPMSSGFYAAKSIVIAAKMAEDAINTNSTLLRDYKIALKAGDGQCKADMVMKSFVDYIIHTDYEKLIGILGPACSETVEPLIGVSKHYKTVIISYGAEGSSLSDKSQYPYFFRTIGENRQYKYVYLALLEKFGWQRVAALTEDGQKYTEYLSYMNDLLRDNGVNLIANIKFPREREIDVMGKYLQDLKQKRARIIIADVNDQVARQVLCEAYKLEMTATQGYVWFLPLWLHPDWYDADLYNMKNSTKIPCTTADMKKAINGHFGVSHAYYAPDNDVMQVGITVKEWRRKYVQRCASQNQQVSAYAGYTYDAMWTYALAMDRLLKENQSYVFDLHSDHTVNRFTDIIAQTDFHGVSGHIKFIGGTSRYSVINVIQRVDDEIHEVGKFYPNVTDTKNYGGRLDLNMSAVVWLSKKKPDDGSEPPKQCVLSVFAQFLDVSCEGAIVIVNIIGFGVLGVVLVIGFIIFKRKYDKKVQDQEKQIKSLGLDLLPNSETLNIWQIPRENVVINRKLGEGAFGTVYGGEAFFPGKGWLSVAVKTLKTSCTTEEKLDFLREFEIMKRFDHVNIIKLLAVCIKCDPILTVMEFMLYGDLKTYLLARRNLVNDSSNEDSNEISNRRLTSMALDVARALSYLAQQKYVHRDVASRNCLINTQRVVKLGDFGMTRPLYENDYYRFNRRGMLPVRWMAPESLVLGIFTPASDIWSYGVLLYEIITFGNFPFQGKSNNEVLSHVKAGNSLTLPNGLDSLLERLINSCWRRDYLTRNKAPDIVEYLAEHPNLLHPCLGAPSSGVQLENTGKMKIELPEDSRKFSLPLSWPQQISKSALKSLQPSPLLVDINDVNDSEPQSVDQIIALLLSAQKNEQESSKPLLSQSSRYSEQINNDPNTEARYINIQPGVVQNLKMSNDDITVDIPLNERKSEVSESQDLDQISFV